MVTHGRSPEYMKCRGVLEVFCAPIEAVIPARKHEKHRNIFSPSFSVIRKGSCGNFALSTACYSAFHFCAIFLGIVDCVVIEQSWGVPVHVTQ